MPRCIPGETRSSRVKVRSQMPYAAAIPPRSMAIARRTATPASSIFRSARRRQVFVLASRNVRFFFLLPRVSWGIKSFFFFQISDVRAQEHATLQ